MKKYFFILNLFLFFNKKIIYKLKYINTLLKIKKLIMINYIFIKLFNLDKIS